jgi:hypothetical protein
MGFGRWLVEHNKLSIDEVLGALQAQRRNRESIGEIAIRTGLLKKEAVLEILDIQVAGERHLRFGEIGRGLGLTTSDDIERCIRAQEASRQPLGEVLIKSGVLTRSEMDQYLRSFQASEPR